MGKRLTSKELLARYVRLAIAEGRADARVSEQLVEPDGSAEEEADVARASGSARRALPSCPERDVNEFSGAGSIAGYTAPLGSGDGLYVKKERKR